MDTIPLLPDFRDLLRYFNEEKVEYLVIGGMAVNYYGYHRSTGDLDLWVAVSPENEDRLAGALRKFGFSKSTCSRSQSSYASDNHPYASKSIPTSPASPFPTASRGVKFRRSKEFL